MTKQKKNCLPAGRLQRIAGTKAEQRFAANSPKLYFTVL